MCNVIIWNVFKNNGNFSFTDAYLARESLCFLSSVCDLIWSLLLLLLYWSDVLCPVACLPVCSGLTSLPYLFVFYRLRACKGGGDGWVQVLKDGGERCRSLTAGLQWVMTGLIAGKSGRLSSDRDEQPLRPLLLNFSCLLSPLCVFSSLFLTVEYRWHIPLLLPPFFRATSSSFIYCCFLASPLWLCK